MQFQVTYIAQKTATVEVLLQPHAHLNGDVHKPTGGSTVLRFNITEQDIANGSIPLRDVATGELLNVNMQLGQLFTGVAQFIRQKEIEANQPVLPAADPI